MGVYAPLEAQDDKAFTAVNEVLHANSVVGMRLRGPLNPPQPGETVLGYQVYVPKKQFLNLRDLNEKGWIATGILLVVAWPLFWAPTCFSTFYEPYQRPVYGMKSDQPQQPQQGWSKSADSAAQYMFGQPPVATEPPKQVSLL